MIGLLGLLGCPKPPPPEGEAPLILEEASPENLPETVSPGIWSERGAGPGRLHLTVPEGWSGTSDRVGSPLLLSLTHEDTGVLLEVHAWGDGSLEPKPREGCTWLFRDDGNHRAVPLLGHSQVASCVSGDPGGPLVQGYYGRVTNRAIHVEITTPHTLHFVGLRVAEPLLRGLSVVP